jgi:hypothetical protein
MFVFLKKECRVSAGYYLRKRKDNGKGRGTDIRIYGAGWYQNGFS